MKSWRNMAGLCSLVVAACQGQIGDPAGDGSGRGPSGSGDPTTDASCQGESPLPVVARLRRLTFEQYDRSVQELVGLDVTPSTELGPQVDGVTPVFWSGIEAAAASVARQAAEDPNALARLAPCAADGDEDACAASVISGLGRRAYRRPLTDSEQARFTALWDARATLTEGGTFAEGIQLVLEALLQAPGFLLRVERSVANPGSRVALTGYERATRMSYGLWNAPPDNTLLDAAERGDLDTVAGVRAQATRMLTSAEGQDRAKVMLRDAHSEWLGMVGAYAAFWSNTTRDPELYPEFEPGIDVSFREEVLRFTELVTFDRGGSFQDLFTSSLTQVNDQLAPIYGVASPAPGEWQTVELNGDQRPGLLTRAGFVGTHGRFGRGSLIFRGAFVLERLLCEEIGAPPAGADATPLPDSSETLITTRQRIEAMTAGSSCAFCHTGRINPAGFALESFDGIGRYREMDNGVPVDTTGELVLGSETITFNGARDYSEQIAASPRAHACYVKSFTQYAFQDDSVELGCAGERLASRLGESDVPLTDFLIDLVSSDAFLYRSSEEIQ